MSIDIKFVREKSSYFPASSYHGVSPDDIALGQRLANTIHYYAERNSRLALFPPSASYLITNAKATCSTEDFQKRFVLAIQVYEILSANGILQKLLKNENMLS